MFYHLDTDNNSDIPVIVILQRMAMTSNTITVEECFNIGRHVDAISFQNLLDFVFVPVNDIFFQRQIYE